MQPPNDKSTCGPSTRRISAFHSPNEEHKDESPSFGPSHWDAEYTQALGITSFLDNREYAAKHPTLSFFLRHNRIPLMSRFDQYLDDPEDMTAHEATIVRSILKSIAANSTIGESVSDKPFVQVEDILKHSLEIPIVYEFNRHWIPKYCRGLYDILEFVRMMNSNVKQHEADMHGFYLSLIKTLLSEGKIGPKPKERLEYFIIVPDICATWTAEILENEKNRTLWDYVRDVTDYKKNTERDGTRYQRADLVISYPLNPNMPGWGSSQIPYELMTEMKRSNNRVDLHKLILELYFQAGFNQMRLDPVRLAELQVVNFGLLMQGTKVEVHSLNYEVSFCHCHLFTYELSDVLEAAQFLVFLFKYKAYCEFLRSQNLIKTSEATGEPPSVSSSSVGSREKEEPEGHGKKDSSRDDQERPNKNRQNQSTGPDRAPTDGPTQREDIKQREKEGDTKFKQLIATRPSGVTIWQWLRNGDWVITKKLPKSRQTHKELKYLLALQGFNGVVEALEWSMSKGPLGLFYEGVISITMPLLMTPSLENAEEARQATIQLLEALEQVHSQGFIHGDIKPDNIGKHPKTGRYQLFDFGGAVQAPFGKRVLIPIPTIRAPELKESYKNEGSYYGTSLIDEYALGVTLDYWLRSVEFDIDTDVNDAINALLEPETKRPTAAELLSRLSPASEIVAQHQRPHAIL